MPDYIIRHPVFDVAANELLRKLDRTMPGDIHFVVGLPGAGKSVLCKTVINKIAGNPFRWGVGRIPAIKVRAAPTDHSFYSPKDMQIRLNEELQTPRLEWVIPRREEDSDALDKLKQEISELQNAWSRLTPVNSENALRRAFERSARERGVQYVFIDQAGSIAFTQRGRHPSEHMYSLMCLAEEIPVTLILFGTPRIRALWAGNGEIRRRSTFTFIRRYLASAKMDITSFARLCLNLTKDLQFTSNAHPTKMLQLIYAVTLAVFDEVRKYFLRAEDHRKTAGARAITQAHLEAAALPKAELEALYEDAAALDEMMLEADGSKLARRLGRSK
jgi:hypothetical protein